MGLSDLPLANAEKHAACFERLGWVRDWKRRGRGSHILLTKIGMRATLSIPDHKEVKRATLAGLIRAAEITQEEYLKEFHKK